MTEANPPLEDLHETPGALTWAKSNPVLLVCGLTFAAFGLLPIILMKGRFEELLAAFGCFSLPIGLVGLFLASRWRVVQCLQITKQRLRVGTKSKSIEVDLRTVRGLHGAMIVNNQSTNTHGGGFRGGITWQLWSVDAAGMAYLLPITIKNRGELDYLLNWLTNELVPTPDLIFVPGALVGWTGLMMKGPVANTAGMRTMPSSHLVLARCPRCWNLIWGEPGSELPASIDCAVCKTSYLTENQIIADPE